MGIYDDIKTDEMRDYFGGDKYIEYLYIRDRQDLEFDKPRDSPLYSGYKTINLVTYGLANHSGYKLDLVRMGRHTFSDTEIYDRSNFPDLKITHPTLKSIEKLHTKALVTVNGYVQKTIYEDNAIYIENALHDLDRSKSNLVGIVSFNMLKENITKTAITKDMLSFDSHILPIEKVIITSKEDIKLPILILAGYMIFPSEEFFYRVATNAFVLRLDRLSYLEKLYELDRYTDIFTKLGVPRSEYNSSVIENSRVTSKETIIKLLTLDNSFIVNLPAEVLQAIKVTVDYSSIPGVYRTGLTNRAPMFGGYGKLLEYSFRRSVSWPHEKPIFEKMKHANGDFYRDYVGSVIINVPVYELHTQHIYTNNYLFSKVDNINTNLYNAHRIPGNTYTFTTPTLLKAYMITGGKSGYHHDVIDDLHQSVVE